MKPGRNDVCHCGSGQKYKKCCLPKDDAARAAELAQQAETAAADRARELALTADADAKPPVARAAAVVAKPHAVAPVVKPPRRRRAV